MRTGLKIFSLALLLTVGSLCTAPRARAMDPVTLALLAPAAMRMAEATHPYLMNGLACGARGLAKTGISAFKTLYLPLGAVEASDRSRHMGIGLSVCRAIVRAHGGEIYARNKIDGGAEFRF